MILFFVNHFIVCLSHGNDPDRRSTQWYFINRHVPRWSICHHLFICYRYGLYLQSKGLTGINILIRQFFQWRKTLRLLFCQRRFVYFVFFRELTFWTENIGKCPEQVHIIDFFWKSVSSCFNWVFQVYKVNTYFFWGLKNNINLRRFYIWYSKWLQYFF